LARRPDRTSGNRRSFAEIERKRNADSKGRPAQAQLAFVYRDTAENERQLGEAG
jgi:hypothetical protein